MLTVSSTVPLTDCRTCALAVVERALSKFNATGGHLVLALPDELGVDGKGEPTAGPDPDGEPKPADIGDNKLADCGDATPALKGGSAEFGV